MRKGIFPKPISESEMKISRERLIEEVALLMVEVRELREENLELKKEFERYDWVSESVENENLSSDIIDCSFSVRTLNTLQKLNILTVKELVSFSELELYKKGVRGKSTMRDINNVLSSLGLVLKYKKLELGMTVN